MKITRRQLIRLIKEAQQPGDDIGPGEYILADIIASGFEMYLRSKYGAGGPEGREGVAPMEFVRAGGDLEDNLTAHGILINVADIVMPLIKDIEEKFMDGGYHPDRGNIARPGEPANIESQIASGEHEGEGGATRITDQQER